MSTKLKDWMKLATTTEQTELATRIGSSRNYLYQVSNGQRTASACFALNVENITRSMARSSKGRLPVVKVGDICPSCGKCPYYAKCNSKK